MEFLSEKAALVWQMNIQGIPILMDQSAIRRAGRTSDFYAFSKIAPGSIAEVLAVASQFS